MRITGGALRGRRLTVPKSASIRPMRDAVRAALFSILGDLVPGSRFLDLFAGTGSVGIEALSRGAKHTVFVDNSAEAVKIIEENLQNLGLTGKATVCREDVFKALELLSRRNQRFDLVFIGPPYGEDLARRTLEQLGRIEILSEGAVAAAEIFKKEGTAFEERYGGLVLFDERTYGDNMIKLYRMEV